MNNPLLIYLREESKNKPVWNYNNNNILLTDIKKAIKKIKVTDPLLYRSIVQIFNPTNPKVIAENLLKVDLSTLLRNWEKASNLIMNRVLNADVILTMHGIDVLQRDTYI